MKFNKLTLLPLLTISLISCTPNNISSEISENASSLITSTSSSAISSNESSLSGGETSEEQANWSANDISFMKTHLNGYVVPYAPIEGGEWIFNQYENCIAYRKKFGTLEDINYFAEEMVKAGYIDGTSEENGCFNQYQRYVYLPLKDTKRNENINMFITRYLKTQEFNADVYYHIDNNSWPQDDIDQAIKLVHDVDVKLPKPSFAYIDLEINAIKEFGQCIISLFGENHSQDYYNDLLNAGFVSSPDVFYEHQVLDANQLVYVAISFEEDLGATTISVMKKR